MPWTNTVVNSTGVPMGVAHLELHFPWCQCSYGQSGWSKRSKIRDYYYLFELFNNFTQKGNQITRFCVQSLCEQHTLSCIFQGITVSYGKIDEGKVQNHGIVVLMGLLNSLTHSLSHCTKVCHQLRKLYNAMDQYSTSMHLYLH